MANALRPSKVDQVTKNLRLPHPPRTPSLPCPNPTKSFWTHGAPDANPLAREGAVGALPADADVVIIGSGITGVSAAYHLSQQLEGSDRTPLRVAILEARDFCSGATGRNGGHLIAGVLGDFRQRVELYGKDDALRSIAIENYTVSTILRLVDKYDLAPAIELQHGGFFWVFDSADERHTIEAEWNAVIEAGGDLPDLCVYEASWMEKEHGIARPALHLDGRNLWPLKLVTQIYKLAKSSASLQLSLHTHAPVTAITAIGPRWALHTARGIVTTTRVLHATNAYAAYLLPHLHGPQGIVPTRGQAIATRSCTPPLRPASYAINGTSQYWFQRPLAVGEKVPLCVVGGARREAKPGLELYVSDDATVNAAVGAKLRDTLPSVFPEKFDAKVQPEIEWSGIMGYTDSGDPFVGPIVDGDGKELHGQYIAAGYHGHGMPRTFACAEAVAGIIVADIEGKEWTVPKWLPRQYLTMNFPECT